MITIATVAVVVVVVLYCEMYTAFLTLYLI